MFLSKLGKLICMFLLLAGGIFLSGPVKATTLIGDQITGTGLGLNNSTAVVNDGSGEEFTVENSSYDSTNDDSSPYLFIFDFNRAGLNFYWEDDSNVIEMAGFYTFSGFDNVITGFELVNGDDFTPGSTLLTDYSFTADTITINLNYLKNAYDDFGGYAYYKITLADPSQPSPSHTPEPATAVLFEIGLLGLACAARRKA